MAPEGWVLRKQGGQAWMTPQLPPITGPSLPSTISMSLVLLGSAPVLKSAIRPRKHCEPRNSCKIVGRRGPPSGHVMEERQLHPGCKDEGGCCCSCHGGLSSMTPAIMLHLFRRTPPPPPPPPGSPPRMRARGSPSLPRYGATLCRSGHTRCYRQGVHIPCLYPLPSGARMRRANGVGVPGTGEPPSVAVTASIEQHSHQRRAWTKHWLIISGSF